MRKAALITTLVAAALLSGGFLAKRAEAMPATPVQLGIAAADSGVVHKAAVVCGYYGCVRVRRPYYGYYRPYWYHRPYGYPYYRPYWYYRPYGYYGYYGWPYYGWRRWYW